MYQPYPDGGQSPTEQYGQGGQPGQPVMTAPPSVVRAVQLMYAGAVASLIGIVIAVATMGSIKSELLKRSPNLTPAQLNTADHFTIIAAVVGGVIYIGLWIWMALMNKRGRNWARIVSTVFFGIDTLSVLGSVAAVGALGGVGVSRFYGIIIWLIGLAAIILLWRRQSSEYFKSAPRN